MICMHVRMYVCCQKKKKEVLNMEHAVSIKLRPPRPLKWASSGRGLDFRKANNLVAVLDLATWQEK